MKIKYNYRNLIIVGIILLGLYLFSIWFDVRSMGDTNLRDVNFYTVWYQTLFGSVSQYFALLAPILIMIGCVQPFFEELKTSVAAYKISRSGYVKYMLKGFLGCYLRSLFLFPLFFIVLFGVCYLFFNHQPITDTTVMLDFAYLDQFTHWQYFLASVPLVCFLGIFVINITMLVAKYIHKFYLAVIASFILFLCLNIGIAEFFTSLTGSSGWWVSSFFGAYMPESSIDIPSIILFLILGIVVTIAMNIGIYWNRESALLTRD